MDRRRFLIGTAGTVVGLPVLESLVFDPKAKGANEPASFAVFLYQPMGPEKDSWWPSKTGKITAESLAGRGTEPLAPYADKAIFINGLGHANETNRDQGDHGDSIAMTLSGAQVEFGPGGEGNAQSTAPSIDHAIAKAFGGSPLNLASPDDGGPSISWAASKVANAPEYDPLKAYKTLFPNGEKGPKTVDEEKAALRKGVNDLVREQMQALLSNPKISKNDKDRLELHMSNIRDLESNLLREFSMPDGDRMAIESFDGSQARASSSRVITPKMHADIIAIAAATGQKRAMTLQLSRYIHDTECDINGRPVGGNWHEGVTHTNDRPKLKTFDILNQRNFAYLLKALDQYKFNDNGKSLLDYGVCTFIISLGFGQFHWRWDLPHVVVGSANGKLKTGYYHDLLAPGVDRTKKFIPTNRFFSSIGRAVGAAGTENFNARVPKKDANTRLDQKGYIDQMFV